MFTFARSSILRVFISFGNSVIRFLFGNSVLRFITTIFAGGAPAEGRDSTPYLYVGFCLRGREPVIPGRGDYRLPRVRWRGAGGFPVPNIFGRGVFSPPRIIGGSGPAPDNSQGRQWVHYPSRIGRFWLLRADNCRRRPRGDDPRSR